MDKKQKKTIQKSGSGVLEISQEDDALENLTKRAIDSTNTSLKELISNSMDARPKSFIKIIYDSFNKIFSIEDDGEGMDDGEGKNSLKRFFKVGGSGKGEEDIGDLGLGVKFIKHETEILDLVTIKNNIEYRVEDYKFEKVLKFGQNVPYNWKPVKNKRSGTKITLKNVKFGEETGFNLGNFRRSVQSTFRILPDYKIIINDKEVEPIGIRSATSFPVEFETELTGYVKGDLHLTSNTTPNAGIHVYVNNVRIENTEKIVDFNRLSYSLIGKVIGMIEANGLKKATKVNKSQFKLDHPSYLELQKKINEEVKKIKYHIRKGSSTKKIKKLIKNKDQILREVQDRLIKNKLLKPTTIIEYASDIPSHLPGAMDKKTIYLNQSYPSLIIAPDQTEEKQAIAIHNAIFDILVLKELGEQDEDTILDEFLEKRASLINKYRGLDSTPHQTSHISLSTISLNALYSLSDLTALTNRPIGEIRYMIKSGILNLNENEKIRGHDYLKIAKKIEGRISLHKIVSEIYGTMTRSVMDHFNKFFYKKDSIVEPFIENFGKNENTAYFIDVLAIEKIKQLFRSDDFRTKAGKIRAIEWFKDWGDSMYSANELEEELNNIKKREIYEIVNSSKKVRKTYGNVDPEFCLRDFVKAAQEYRTNKKKSY